MMDFELRLSKPSTKKAPLDGLVMGVSYFLGKYAPLPPSMGCCSDFRR